MNAPKLNPITESKTTSARLIVCLKNSRSRFFDLFFSVRFVAKQKCLEEQIGICLLGTRLYNFTPYTPTQSHNAQRYRQSDGQRDDIMMPIKNKADTVLPGGTPPQSYGTSLACI